MKPYAPQGVKETKKKKMIGRKDDGYQNGYFCISIVDIYLVISAA